MSEQNAAVSSSPAPGPNLWSRDGFLGTNAIAVRAEYLPTYVSVTGPHKPQRLSIFDIEAEDQDNELGMPTTVMESRCGLALAVSRRSKPMPFAVRNAEGDELHFIQSGKVRFHTDFGVIEAGPLDFVCIPRAVTFRVEPLTDDLAVLILVSPNPLRFDTPAPFGMVNFAKNVRRAVVTNAGPASAGPHKLFIKSFDGVTQFEMLHDPVQAVAQVGGEQPVWALSLRDVIPIVYGDIGGPPAQFLSTADTGVMSYTLSARLGGRPPVHVNADYDEIVIYAEGPGAWGNVDQPGTLTWVPKAVTHHGPVENVPEGYQAWLIEVRPTMRLTEAAAKHARLMETSLYGFQNEE